MTITPPPANRYCTKPEQHWQGKDGDEWTDRSWNNQILASKVALLSKILDKTKDIQTVLEFGPNTGQSLYAIKTLLPSVSCCGVEINRKAAQALKERMPFCEVIEGSILDITLRDTYDFVFTSGLLIHIVEDSINRAYDQIYNSSNRYIGIVEYYNPTPVDINYRGEKGVLFKRDFAGEMMDRFPDLQLVDYGFVYHRDYNFPADDVNWFLLKKS
jgi:spore coat polysaccharide biosynthesis protein SpsF